jgi:hypothetical protein
MDSDSFWLMLACLFGSGLFLWIVVIVPLSNWAGRKEDEGVKESLEGKNRSYDKTWK